MIKIYTLVTRAMNGTVTMMSHADSFLTKELAEEAENAVLKANSGSTFPVITDIQESTVFENREEVPILNKEKDGDK